MSAWEATLAADGHDGNGLQKIVVKLTFQVPSVRLQKTILMAVAVFS